MKVFPGIFASFLLFLLSGCGNTADQPEIQVVDSVFDSGTADNPPRYGGTPDLPSRSATILKNAKPNRAGSTMIRLVPAMVVDNSGFSQPMVAGTVFIPHGWQTRGGVVWAQEHACTNGYAFNWAAESADGLSLVAILPQQSWEWNNSGQPANPACRLLQINSAEAYIRAVIQHTLPEARIISIRQRSDLERELANRESVSDSGFQRIETRVNSAEAFFEFEKDGVRLQGNVIASVEFTHIRTGGQYAAPIESLSSYAFPAFASYGPAGSHDLSFFEALRKSYLPSQAWIQQINQHNSTMGRIALQGIRDRIAIQTQTQAEISQMLNQAWQNQQISSDRRAREFIESIRDVETYNDSAAPGGQVQLSSFYDQAWALDDGSYVVTSDPSFEPNQYLGINGEQLTVTK